MPGKGFLSGKADNYRKCLWGRKMTKVCLRDNEGAFFYDFHHISLWHKQLQRSQNPLKWPAPLGSKVMCSPRSRTAVKDYSLESTRERGPASQHLPAQAQSASYLTFSFFYCPALLLLISAFREHQQATRCAWPLEIHLRSQEVHDDLSLPCSKGQLGK